MHMKPFFTELFEYSHPFNQKLFEVIESNPNQVSEKAILLFNHIVNAHQIWNNRIDSQGSAFGVWQIHPISEIKNIDQTNLRYSIHILDHYELNSSVQYSNNKGQVFTQSIQDILFHIINHSTYHRGQIATECKQQGLDPLPSDYIVFTRK
jgi:uncharacterized damage-inducible protein DinB